MVRISAIFIAVCMVLVAGSIGFVVYLRFGLTGAERFWSGSASSPRLRSITRLLPAPATARKVSDQIASTISRSSPTWRASSPSSAASSAPWRPRSIRCSTALASAQPLAVEIEELSTLVKHLANSVAAHEAALAGLSGKDRIAPAVPAMATAAAHATAAVPMPDPAAAPAAPIAGTIAAFNGLDQNGIVAAINSAIDGSKIELYLQPIVTLPQRKVRYYEALSRLKADNGDLVAAGDFLKFAEAGGLMPKLDNLSLLRCVQVVRRLLLKNRDIGLFCNLSSATLTNSGFQRFLEFAEANRAIAPALVFEFTQEAVRAMGPIERESLAALAERGYRFSMDNLTDLRVEPRELNERGFRFIKAPAALLLNRVGAASTDIHPADLSDLLGRFGIDLIAERIEAEGAVVDLLDYDVRFGQGFLFSPPRPVRAEALQGADAAKSDAADQAKRDASAPRGAGLAQLARTGSGRP